MLTNLDRCMGVLSSAAFTMGRRRWEERVVGLMVVDIYRELHVAHFLDSLYC